MINQLAEKTIARVLGIGSAFVAMIVATGSVTDPVNVTKLFALGGVAVAAFAVLAIFGLPQLWTRSRLLIVVAALLLLSAINAVVNSDAPLTQNLYGVYGRNTAFLTYLLLILIALAAAILRASSSFTILIWGLLSAGFVNVAYSMWVIIFGDFVPWSNPYGNILGTFGNPNFIGAFLGLFAASLVAYSFNKGVSVGIRIASAALFIVTVYAIIDSSAIQGRVVVVAGLAIVGFYLVRSKFTNSLAQIGYLVTVTIGGVFALLGALQIGPLTKYIYKTSVSLRGEYWQAGWNMGSNKPFTGVGFDTYGDWFRSARDTQALVMPGPNTVTNAAHNVPLDVFAFGGWPLFISYIGLLVLSVVAIIKVTLRSRTYDGVFVTLTTAWVCYQLQSIISINQIGLAIWGWLFGGALIAYEISTRQELTSNSVVGTSTEGKNTHGRRAKPKQSETIFSSTLIAGIGGVIGLIIACPPYSADAKWKSALESQNLQKIEEALVPGYLNPMNSYKYVSAIQLLETSKLPDLAYKYAVVAVDFNPDHFDSWRMLYYISKSSVADKAKALQNMKRLDPNNPSVLG